MIANGEIAITEGMAKVSNIFERPKLSMVQNWRKHLWNSLAERLSRHEILKARQREQPAVPGSPSGVGVACSHQALITPLQ